MIPQYYSLLMINSLISYQVKKSVCNTAAGGKRVVVILELEIVTPGAQVGAKLGSPQMIGADGEWWDYLNPSFKHI